MNPRKYRGAMIEGPRAARADELDAVIELATTVFRREGDTDMGAAFPTLFNAGNLENLQIMLDAGRPVALAGAVLRDLSISGARLPAGLVGAVCTREDLRGQGLAGRVVEQVVARCSELGAAAVLISGARTLYRRMGCVDAGLWQTVHVRETDALPRPACAVTEWSARDVPEMIALYEAEPVRFERGAEEMRLLLEARSLYAHPARTWVCRVGGALAAYVCCAGPERAKEWTVLEALEIAGSRRAILSAMPAILAATGASGAEIETTASDLEMTDLARAHNLSSVLRGFHGTMKIVDTARLFNAMEGNIAGRLTAAERAGLAIECGATVFFRYKGAELAVSDPADLAALVFGSVEREPPVAEDRTLQEVLARLFPLPLPSYGLNYI